MTDARTPRQLAERILADGPTVYMPTSLIVARALIAAEDALAWRPTHRHYKGGLYKLLFTATHSETHERFAVYEGSRAMTGQDAGEVFHRWVRPLPMFEGTLADGRRRFTPLADILIGGSDED